MLEFIESDRLSQNPGFIHAAFLFKIILNSLVHLILTIGRGGKDDEREDENEDSECC